MSHFKRRDHCLFRLVGRDLEHPENQHRHLDTVAQLRRGNRCRRHTLLS
jgi:hypothetical protein